MNRYQVTFYLGSEQKQVILEAENTGEVFAKLEKIEPNAHDITIERIDE